MEIYIYFTIECSFLIDLLIKFDRKFLIEANICHTNEFCTAMLPLCMFIYANVCIFLFVCTLLYLCVYVCSYVCL